MTKSIYLIVFAAGAFAFTSCNTFIGLGRDVQSLGGSMVNTGNRKGQATQAQPTSVDPAQTLPPQAPAQ